LNKYIIMVDWSNKEFVLEAVTRNGWDLEYAHNDLKKDREIVLAAVTRYGLVLQFVHDDLRKDREIVLAAAIQNGYSLYFAHEDLKNDEYFLYEVDQIKKITISSYILNCINERIQDEIRGNPDYLLDFAPVNIKPAKR
jgi:hypothetical protein